MRQPTRLPKRTTPNTHSPPPTHTHTHAHTCRGMWGTSTTKSQTWYTLKLPPPTRHTVTLTVTHIHTRRGMQAASTTRSRSSVTPRCTSRHTRGSMPSHVSC